MPGYNQLKASNGTGNAVLAHITAAREIGATVIQVDSLDNWNDEFIVVTGNLNPSGFLIPATMTEMLAHQEAGDIIIDGFAPGYSDVGNSENQVAVIKPTTHIINSLVENAEVSHNDDGTLKANSVDTQAVANRAVTMPKHHNPYSFRAYRSVNQGINPAVATKVVLQTESFDINGDYDAVTNHRYNVPVTGQYQFNGAVSINADDARLRCALYVNGVVQTVGNESTKREATVHDVLNLTAGDYVELYVIPAAIATVGGTATGTYLSGFLINQT